MTAYETSKFIFLFLLVLSVQCTAQSSNKFKDAELYGSYDSLYTAIQIETLLSSHCTEAGKIYIDYVVNENGTVENVEIAKGLCPNADSIAVHIVKRMKFSPALKHGTSVRVRKSIPIYFRIE